MNRGDKIAGKNVLKNNFHSLCNTMLFIFRRAFLQSGILCSLLLIPFFSFSGDFPARSNTLVTDYTNTLNSEQRNALEQKLVAFNDSTSTQIAVVILSSVGSYDIADYSVQLFNQWKIGQEKKNNGVLVLVAKDDRKVWITTGYGIEGVLPDALCKRVIDRDIVPNFKQGDFYGGLDQGTNSIMSLVKGEFTADDYMQQRKEKPVPWFAFVMFIVIFFIVIFSKILRTRRYASTNHLGFWAAWALLNAAASRSRGSWGGFSGGGGFGGGSFGGFGGGSSGGGGAGGSW